MVDTPPQEESNLNCDLKYRRHAKKAQGKKKREEDGETTWTAYKVNNTYYNSLPENEREINTLSLGYGEMFCNFMDYTPDKYMWMFTRDQAAKIRDSVHVFHPACIRKPTRQENKTHRRRLVLTREEQKKADAEYLHYHKCLLRCAEHVADEQMKARQALQEKLEQQQDAIKSHGGGHGGGVGTGFWRVFGGGRAEADSGGKKTSGIAAPPSGSFVLPASRATAAPAAKLGIEMEEEGEGGGAGANKEKKKKEKAKDRGTGIWALTNVFRGLATRGKDKGEEEEGEDDDGDVDTERFMGLDERRPTIHDDGHDDEESGDEIELPASGQPLLEFTDKF